MTTAATLASVINSATGKLNTSILNAGGVVQVVQAAYATSVSTTSTSFVNTGLSASITPTSASNKIAVIICQTLSPTSGGSSTFGSWRVMRDASQIYQDLRINMYMQFAHGTYSCVLLDSPATTSSVAYTTQMATGSASFTLEAQHASIRTSTIMLMEIAV